MIRAIALDVDGTITYQNRQLDVSAVGAIRKAEESGIPVCLATGNVLCFARTASVLFGTSGPLIAEDGGVVYDQSDAEEYILGDAEEADEGIKILEEELEDIQHTTTSLRRRTGRTLERTIDVQKATEILRENELSVTAVDSGFAIHVKDPKVNKGKALRKAASILGISPSEMAAIGDAPNDVEMLQSAGLSFTPANASSEAKKISSHTAEEPHGRGVKEVVDLILEKRE